MADITHRVGIKAPSFQGLRSAIQTVEGVACWWQTHTSGSSRVGGTIEVRFHSTDGKEIGDT